MSNLTVGRADLLKKEDLAEATKNGLFDTIICLNVVEHIEDDVKVMRNFHDILKPGGRAIILVPHDPSNYTAVDKTLGHFRRYTRKELSSKAEQAGFKVRKCWGFNRVGGLGWRVSGKILRKKTLGAGQMTLFEMLMPIVRLMELIPFHSHNSVIVVAERPKD
jgi:SAM-dependent methyltransferase